jgi:hypothetical protein
MSDIPKMLRSGALIADEDWTGIYGISPNLAFAAADRIAKLEAALRGVIDNFFDSTRICEIARKALEGKDETIG